MTCERLMKSDLRWCTGLSKKNQCPPIKLVLSNFVELSQVHTLSFLFTQKYRKLVTDARCLTDTFWAAQTL